MSSHIHQPEAQPVEAVIIPGLIDITPETSEVLQAHAPLVASLLS